MQVFVFWFLKKPHSYWYAVFVNYLIYFFFAGNTSCPPEWRELSPMECYKIMTNPTDGLVWSTAQEYCGYSMSNLIVIPTEAIFTVIQGKKSQNVHFKSS